MKNDLKSLNSLLTRTYYGVFVIFPLRELFLQSSWISSQQIITLFRSWIILSNWSSLSICLFSTASSLSLNRLTSMAILSWFSAKSLKSWSFILALKPLWLGFTLRICPSLINLAFAAGNSSSARSRVNWFSSCLTRATANFPRLPSPYWTIRMNTTVSVTGKNSLCHCYLIWILSWKFAAVFFI